VLTHADWVVCPRAPLQCDLKYIDPSYMIRASATITTDRIYCKVDSHSPRSMLCLVSARICRLLQCSQL
jgi:hypothetical protein